MEPSIHNIRLFRGADFKQDFQFINDDGTPKDIRDWEFKAQIRTEDCFDSTLLASFSITKDINTGTIYLQLTDTQTKALPEGTAYWALMVNIADFVEPYIRGKVKIKCIPTEV